MDWNAVVRDLGSRLERYFCVSFPRELAQDLVQETLIRLVRKVERKDYVESQGSLASYAFGIAHYVRLEALKKKPQDLSPETDIPAIEPRQEKQIESAQRKAALRAAIAGLSDTEQQVINLLIDKDLDIKEISNILNMPSGTVKSHIFRAKRNLQAILKRQKWEIL